MDSALGYIFYTGAASGIANKFSRLVTIDLPTFGQVIHSTLGRQGVYVLTEQINNNQVENEVYVLPEPGSNTDVPYESAAKMDYIWRSKKFSLGGRTTFGCAKVVHKGRVRMRLYVEGCCVIDIQVRDSEPFRLPSQISGKDCEIELRGNAVVEEVHIASTMRELLNES